jgi:hypothetical protein
MPSNGGLPQGSGDIEAAVGIPADPTRGQRLPDRRLAHAQGFGQLAITRGSHGDQRSKSTT